MPQSNCKGAPFDVGPAYCNLGISLVFTCERELKLQLCNIQDEEYNEALPHISTGPEGGLSLDLEPADKEPKNQNWVF